MVGGDSKTLDVTPTRKVQSVPLATVGPAPQTAESNWLVPGILWGGTGALAVGGAVFGGLALSSSSSKLGAERDVLDANAASLADRSSSTKTLAVVSDVLVGGAAIAGIFAIYFTVRASSQGSVGPSAAVGFAPGGIRMRGTF